MTSKSIGNINLVLESAAKLRSSSRGNREAGKTKLKREALGWQSPRQAAERQKVAFRAQPVSHHSSARQVDTGSRAALG